MPYLSGLRCERVEASPAEFLFGGAKRRPPGRESIAKLDVPVVTPLGVGARLEKMGVPTIHELDWWEDVRRGGSKFTSTPSRHFSGRTLTDRDDTPLVEPAR